MVMITITISIITFIIIIIPLIISRSISLQGKDVSMHRSRTFDASTYSHLPRRLNINKIINDWYYCFLINKPLQAAGMSDDNVRDWNTVQKKNIWPRNEASRANGKHTAMFFFFFNI